MTTGFCPSGVFGVADLNSAPGAPDGRADIWCYSPATGQVEVRYFDSATANDATSCSDPDRSHYRITFWNFSTSNYIGGLTNWCPVGMNIGTGKP